ncbi:hypothetical protein NQD34_018183 [Periophthalmus magnuspinnatus]|nr:hypothetical protein NQD34_018183 [Periophthalmus magnuspinnatus]
MVHLIPAYKQQLNLSKPAVRTSKKWTSEAVEELRTCLDTTDWDVFKAATDSLDEYADTVTSYIQFCEDSLVLSCTRVTFNNDKPWFTPRHLRREKEMAFRAEDLEGYRRCKYAFSKEVEKAKASTIHVWSSISPPTTLLLSGERQITNYRPKAPPTVDNKQLAEKLNSFYARFEVSHPSPSSLTIMDITSKPTVS